MEASKISREELTLANKELEKKLKNAEAEVLRQEQDLAASERARKDLQTEKEELADEIITATKYAFIFV